MQALYQKLREKIISGTKHFFSLDDTPHSIASGVALGVFFGIIPGEGVTASLVVAALLGINKASAALGALATNMWSTFVVLPPAAMLGGFLFHESANGLMEQFAKAHLLGWRYFLSKVVFFELTLPLITGFLLIALTVAVGAYLGIFFLLKKRAMRVK